MIARNTSAYKDYEIQETYEAGIVLEKNEVKSLREHAVSLKNSYCLIERGEVFLYHCHISPYFGEVNVDPERSRKLLLNKVEIRRLQGKVSRKGFTIIPTKLYFKGNLAKLEIALARAKHKYTKRRELKEKEEKKEMQKLLKYGIIDF